MPGVDRWKRRALRRQPGPPVCSCACARITAAKRLASKFFRGRATLSHLTPAFRQGKGGGDAAITSTPASQLPAPRRQSCPPSDGFFTPGQRGPLAPSRGRVSIRTTAVLIGATDLARWRMFDLSPTPSATAPEISFLRTRTIAQRPPPLAPFPEYLCHLGKGSPCNRIL